MSLRRIVSLSLMLSILGMLISSVMLYIVPQGRVAFWAGWTMWGLSKTQWGAIHTNMGFLMLVAGGFHIYYNWRPLTSYLKNRARRFRLFTPNFNLAFAVFGLFVVLTLLELPPAVWLQDLRTAIEDSGARQLGEPPYGHAEESSLRVFLRNTGLDSDRARANLMAAGITVDDPELSILELATGNGMTPQEFFEILQGPEDQRPTEPLPIPEAMPMGSGRLSLTAFCEQYNRDLDQAVKILSEAGLTVDPQLSLKDNAAANNLEALDLLDLLRQGFGD